MEKRKKLLKMDLSLKKSNSALSAEEVKALYDLEKPKGE